MKTYEKNKTQDQWLFNEREGNVYFLPHRWCEEFQDLDGDANAESGPTAYCYAPTHTRPNSPVALLWVPLAFLDTLAETDEDTARRAHPALDEYLRAIEEGRDP